MRGGLLRKRVTVQQVVNGKWTNYLVNEPVAVEPVTGEEVARQEEPSTTVKSNVVMRYHAGLLPKMRLVFGNRILEISSVINVEERNRELNLVCREVVN